MVPRQSGAPLCGQRLRMPAEAAVLSRKMPTSRPSSLATSRPLRSSSSTAPTSRQADRPVTLRTSPEPLAVQRGGVGAHHGLAPGLGQAAQE